MCYICNKSLTRSLDHQRMKHGMTYKEANMIAREEKGGTPATPTMKGDRFLSLTVMNKLSQKHNLKFGTSQFQKIHDKFYGKVTSPIKPS